MDNQSLFKMPTPVKITARTSSITNAFINGIIPCIMPSEEEIITVLTILGMDKTSICCAYCGEKYTEWDHFHPLILNKGATGYISEINNLVPACGKCNQSKGNSNWKKWIKGNAQLSPHTRKIVDLNERIKRLEAYEKWSRPRKIDFEKIVGKEKWERHWNNCEHLHEQMRESQKLSDEIKKAIHEYSERHKNVAYSRFVPKSTDSSLLGGTARATNIEISRQYVDSVDELGYESGYELDEDPKLYQSIQDDRPTIQQSKEGNNLAGVNNQTKHPANASDAWKAVKEIRAKKNQSWVQLKEGCNAILAGSYNCRPGAKSFASVVMRYTGLSASDILEMLNNKGL